MFCTSKFGIFCLDLIFLELLFFLTLFAQPVKLHFQAYALLEQECHFAGKGTKQLMTIGSSDRVYFTMSCALLVGR